LKTLFILYFLVILGLRFVVMIIRKAVTLKGGLQGVPEVNHPRLVN